MQSTKWLHGAKRRRVHAKFRARLLGLLGQEPEGKSRTWDDKYPETTGELLCKCRHLYLRPGYEKERGRLWDGVESR